jgi:hypothetical protein
VQQTAGVKLTKITSGKPEVLSGQGPAIASLENASYTKAQAEDDYSNRERHLEGELDLQPSSSSLSDSADSRCSSHEDYLGLWDDFSGSTDKILGELVDRLKGEYVQRHYSEKFPHIHIQICVASYSAEISAGLMILRDYLRQAVDLVSMQTRPVCDDCSDKRYRYPFQMKPVSKKYGSNVQGAQRDTEAITTALFPETRSGKGGFELLMDLHGVFAMFG